MKLVSPLKSLSIRQMLAIPLVLAVVLGAAAAVAFALGTFPMSRDFKGGTLVQARGLENAPDLTTVEGAAENFLGANVDVTKVGGFDFDMEADNFLTENEKSTLENVISTQLEVENKVHVYSMGSIITSIYSEQARNAMIGAVVAMGIIIFIAFRRRFTVGAILLVVGLDMLSVFGCMAIFGVPLSLGSVAGLLMLIGYCVDTNILLSTRVLKRVSGEAREHAADAMKTGLMMSGTTLIVLITLNLLTTASLLAELSAVLIFGIIIDIFNTWFLNAGLLLWRGQKLMGKEFYVSV